MAPDGVAPACPESDRWCALPLHKFAVTIKRRAGRERFLSHSKGSLAVWVSRVNK